MATGAGGISSDAEFLLGLRLESCRFSLGSYSFEFSGTVAGKPVTYSVSTSYNVAVTIPPVEDIQERISTEVWRLLEKTVAKVEVGGSNDTKFIVLKFVDAGNLVLWSEANAMDNLAIVRNVGTGDWFALC